MMQDAVTARHRINSVRRKGRLQLALLILIPAFAMGLAWFLYFFGLQFIPDGRTNKGELIIPPASFQTMTVYDQGGLFTVEQMEGKWGVLIFGEPACSSEACVETLYQTRQAHIALGRETDRVVRLFISPNQAQPSEAFMSEHPGMIWLNSNQQSVIKALNTEKWPENQYFIVDPLGNIMMKYQSGQYGRDLLKDLQKLLKASNIG